jgi:alkylation response protein AidB-like acyl-CoA dehydrogenase
MRVDWSAEELAFRDEVRAFLDAELTHEMRAVSRRMTSVYAPHELSMAWQAILHARGWAAPAWPVEHGGCGWTSAQRYLFASELAAADAPPLSPMGIGMCGPVLIGHGTAEQKAHYLPRILTGEHFWCQGYSEPGAGSDLASLQMSAVEDGDDFVCSGHKLWTTHANLANWMFCLVRTSQEAIRQQGITFLLIDMTSPGVEVRPILMLSGEHIQNDVFFTEVRVPKTNAVGRVGEGWTVAKYLMEFERGGGVIAPGLKARLGRIRAMAAAEGLLGDRGYVARLGAVEIEIAALEAVELQILASLSQDLDQPVEVAVDHGRERVHRQARHQVGEVLQVGDHHGDLAGFRADLHGLAALDDAVDDLRGEVALQRRGIEGPLALQFGRLQPAHHEEGEGEAERRRGDRGDEGEGVEAGQGDRD